MTELMRDSLVLARNLGMDVFNALNLMQNQEFLQVGTCCVRVAGGNARTCTLPLDLGLRFFGPRLPGGSEQGIVFTFELLDT